MRSFMPVKMNSSAKYASAMIASAKDDKAIMSDMLITPLLTMGILTFNGYGLKNAAARFY